MKDKTLIEALSQLRSVNAPDHVYDNIEHAMQTLPGKPRGFYFPLVAFQLAVGVVVVLLLVGTGSGIVLAAVGSNPGTPLYPVKKVLQRVAPQVVQHFAQVIPTATPTPTAMPIKHIQRPTESEKQNPHNDKQQKDVRGIETSHLQGQQEGEKKTMPVEQVTSAARSENTHQGEQKTNNTNDGENYGLHFFQNFFSSSKDN